jgi:hypothetical protein
MNSPTCPIPGNKSQHGVAQFRELPLCSICNAPVPLESAKTDENGEAIHEECYTLKVQRHQVTGST